MKLRGWVYVITNPAMPGLVKIGYSRKDPQLRARELDGSGVPFPYKLEFDAVVEHPDQVERSVHAALIELREGREWFNCSVDAAIAAIFEAAGPGLVAASRDRPNLGAERSSESADGRKDPAGEPEQAVSAYSIRTGVAAGHLETPTILGTKVFQGTCTKCKTSYKVTLSRGEHEAICPTCFTVNEAKPTW